MSLFSRNVRSAIGEVLLIACFFLFGILSCKAQTNTPAPERLPTRVKQVLSWMPADTETILVMAAPFAMPRFKPNDEQRSRETSLDEEFELLPLVRFEVKGGLLQNYLLGERIELAIEGSRHFRPPDSNFGEMHYEGCEIAVLAKASSSRGPSFMKAAAKVAVKTDTVAGQSVAVFQEKHDDDTWTTFVAFRRQISC